MFAVNEALSSINHSPINDKQHGVSVLSDTPFSYYQYFNIFLVYCSDTYVKYGLPVRG